MTGPRHHSSSDGGDFGGDSGGGGLSRRIANDSLTLGLVVAVIVSLLLPSAGIAGACSHLLPLDASVRSSSIFFDVSSDFCQLFRSSAFSILISHKPGPTGSHTPPPQPCLNSQPQSGNRPLRRTQTMSSSLSPACD